MVAVPVFVGGFRSGTTLLINYLGLHPRLSAIYETKFLADLLRIVRIVRDEEGRGELEIAVLRELGWHPACSREEAIAFLIQRARQDIALTQAVLDGLESDGKAAYERYALGANHILWSAAEALEAIEPFVQGVCGQELRWIPSSPRSAPGCGRSLRTTPIAKGNGAGSTRPLRS